MPVSNMFNSRPLIPTSLVKIEALIKKAFGTSHFTILLNMLKNLIFKKLVQKLAQQRKTVSLTSMKNTQSKIAKEE